MILSDIQIGKSCIVKEINLYGSQLFRLNALGINNGSLIIIERYSYFNDPIVIKIKNYHLAIRREIANKIKVEKV